MGCFSWWTIEYNGNLSRPIYLTGFAKLPVFDVWMHTPDGKSYHETKYEGYGKFGGKDYFVALSECNPMGETEQLSQEQHRNRGIKFAYDDYDSEKSKTRKKLLLKFPVFTETATYDGSFDKQCKQCRSQGMKWEDKDPTREVNMWCKGSSRPVH